MKYQGGKNEKENIREKLGGKYIEIADGIVHYEIGGPEDGKWIILVNLIGEKALLKALDDHFYDSKYTPAYKEHFKEQMEYEGLTHAIFSTLQHFPFDMTDQFKQIGGQKRLTMMIWGELSLLLCLEIVCLQ